MKLCKRKGVMCECLTDHSTCNSANCHRKLPDIEFTSEEAKHSLEETYQEGNKVMNNINWMQQGWECPKCGAVMSPTTSCCVNCRGNKGGGTATTMSGMFDARDEFEAEAIKLQEAIFNDFTRGDKE